MKIGYLYYTGTEVYQIKVRENEFRSVTLIDNADR